MMGSGALTIRLASLHLQSQRRRLLKGSTQLLASVFLFAALASWGFEFEPDFEPLVFPTVPPRPFSRESPIEGLQVHELESPGAITFDPGSVNSETANGASSLTLGVIGFTAVIASLALVGVRKNNWGPCIINGALTIANGVGTLLVATGVGVEIGAVLLIVNAVAQLFQLLSDNEAYRVGVIAQEHYYFRLALNIADAVPGLGVLSGVFGLMGTCVFEWAIEWGSTSAEGK